MVTVLTDIILVLVAFSIYALYKLRQYRQTEELRQLVAWCVSEDRDIRANLELFQYVSNAQLDYVPGEYRISGETEWLYTRKILQAYTKNLSESYFHDRLCVPKSRYAVSGNDFFMLKLYRYLMDHQCDYKLCGHDMHKETLSFENHGMWGGMLFDATYALSDFGMVYHKLYYISCLYCKASPVLNPKGDPYRTADQIKAILDAKQIELSRY